MKRKSSLKEIIYGTFLIFLVLRGKNWFFSYVSVGFELDQHWPVLAIWYFMSSCIKKRILCFAENWNVNMLKQK